MPGRKVRYRTSEENTAAQLVESLGESTWPREADLQAWNIRSVELEEKIFVARHYTVNMLEIAEDAEGYAEKIDSLLEAGNVVEVAPEMWIMWGSAVHHARYKAEEYRAMAEIAQRRVKLTTYYFTCPSLIRNIRIKVNT